MFKNIEVILTICFSVIGAAKWIYEYTKKLKWERTKFLSEKMDEFLSDSEIKKVLVMLDWNSANIELDGKYIRYDDNLLMSALTTHNVKSSFSVEEKYIRTLFDNFLDKLMRFQIWIDTGLIDEKDTIRFLGYYLDIMSGKRKSKSKEFVSHLKNYMNFYGYDLKLLN